MKLDRAKVQIAMARKCLDARMVAKRYGCTTGRFYSILRSRAVYPTTAGKLASALGVDVSEIIEEGG